METRANKTVEHVLRATGDTERATDRLTTSASINAGQAVRQNAAETLRQMARVQRNVALERIRDAHRMVDLMEQAEQALNRASHLEALAAEADTLRGPAEEALWNLAVDSAQKGV